MKIQHMKMAQISLQLQSRVNQKSPPPKDLKKLQLEGGAEEGGGAKSDDPESLATTRKASLLLLELGLVRIFGMEKFIFSYCIWGEYLPHFISATFP